MATSKAMPTHTSPRRAAHKMIYLESDSSDEDKSDENALSDDQDRGEVAEALANARSMIGALERGKSMNKDKDETIEVKEKQEDSSFIQTTTMTQVDLCNGDSLSSQASSVLPEETAVSSEVAGPKTPPNMVNRTLVHQTKIQTRGKEIKRIQRRRKLPGYDAEMETFVTMQQETVLHCDAA